MEQIAQVTEQTTEQAAQGTQEAEQTTEQITIQAISIRLDALEKRFFGVEQTPVQVAQIPAQGTCAAESPASVLGFRLVQKNTKTAGKSYRKWYAVKGAALVVYIGRDLAQAETKIRAYCSGRGIELPAGE